MNFLDLTKKEKIQFLALRKVGFVDEKFPSALLVIFQKNVSQKYYNSFFSTKNIKKDSSKLERKLYLIRKKRKKLCLRYKKDFT